MKKVDRAHRQASMLGRAMAGVVIALMIGPAVAEDAKTIAATVCVACHTEDGNSVIPMFPKIAGLQETYIVKQLKDFMSGRRKSDVMGPIVSQLRPEDVAPLAVYFSQQKLKPSAPENRDILGMGKMIFHDGNEETGVPACVGCHQLQGAGFGAFPRIGGQHIEYTKQQLKNFASGERSNDPSRYMRVTAKRLTEEEINAVAQYLVGLSGK